MATRPFQFKQFTIHQERCAMKVGTDSILIGAWADVKSAVRALDIGTGSGIIALMLAQRHAELEVDGVEIDPQAAACAAANVAASPWSERISIFSDKIQNYAVQSSQRYDLIVSNPPFFTVGSGLTSPNPQRQQARHTSTLSYTDLCHCVSLLLKPHGRLSLILPAAVTGTFCQVARQHHLCCTRLTNVRPLPHKPAHRTLMQFEFAARPLQQNELTIEYEHHHYTKAYRALTYPFYLYMSEPEEEGRESSYR